MKENILGPLYIQEKYRYLLSFNSDKLPHPPKKKNDKRHPQDIITLEEILKEDKV
jgi:hypothetical protein